MPDPLGPPSGVESIIAESTVSSFTSPTVPSGSQLPFHSSTKFSAATTFSASTPTESASRLPLHNSTTIPFSTAVVPHRSSATTSHRTTAVTVPISLSLGALAVIVSLVFLRWRKKKRQRTRLPDGLLPISETPPLLGSVRPYITTQHSNSALTLPTQPSSGSLAATSNASSKGGHWLPTAEGARLPLIGIHSAADPAILHPPDQNALLAERLEALQERLYQIESITRIGFVAEEVPPPEYTSNREISTRSGGDERGPGGVGGVARAVSQGASDGSWTLVGVERPVEE